MKHVYGIAFVAALEWPQREHAMIPLVEEHIDEIIELCRDYRIRRLSLFGSTAKGAWNVDTSDIDVLIDLDYSPGVGGRFMKFASSLERLLGRPVDIVTERSITSVSFRDELCNTAVKLYEAGDDQAIA
jgi:predicted nucleotidyltransferase